MITAIWTYHSTLHWHIDLVSRSYCSTHACTILLLISNVSIHAQLSLYLQATFLYLLLFRGNLVMLINYFFLLAWKGRNNFCVRRRKVEKWLQNRNPNFLPENQQLTLFSVAKKISLKLKVKRYWKLI